MNRLTRLQTIFAYCFPSLFALTLTVVACRGSNQDSSLSAVKSSPANLCLGQAANTFHCIDDTQFQHCIGDGVFAVKSCPAGLCATRTPADRNPCIGRERAAEIDGAEPPAAGKANAPAANNNTGNATNNNNGSPSANTGATGNPGAQCVGGPAFDPAGAKNVGNGRGIQFIGGQCLSSADCASGCCAGPCGICSGVGAQTQNGKTGCGFGDKK